MFVIYKYHGHFINKIPCFYDETFSHKHKKHGPTRMKFYPKKAKHSLGRKVHATCFCIHQTQFYYIATVTNFAWKQLHLRPFLDMASQIMTVSQNTLIL
jgi:hypothetical protein